MAKRGPKLTHIDWDDFDKLCYMQCTLIEIAEWFNLSEDTIERYVKAKFKIKFAEYIKRKSCRGKISLRRAMFRKAIEGDNPTMQIWLSKQHLGMQDSPLIEQAVEALKDQIIVYKASLSKDDN